MRDVVDHMEMPLWEHLEVLRWTLIRILIAWAIGVLTSFMFIPSLFNQVVLAPSREDFFLYRFLAKLNSYTSLVPDFLEKPFPGGGYQHQAGIPVFHSHVFVFLDIPADYFSLYDL